MQQLWGPAMFLGALILIFSGYPVAFALAGTALLFALLGVMAGQFDWHLLFAMPERTFGIMSNYTLLAVPFFIFMGAVLEKSRLAEQLLETIGVLFGRFRGGIALGVIVVGTLLAAATGVVGASVTAMGLISLPIMLRYNYGSALSLGVIAGSGTLGQIIPPSIVLIVLGDQLGVSVARLFTTAVVPGLLLAGMYALYVVGLATARPGAAPALPPEARTMGGWQLARRVLFSLVPPLLLIAMVLGSIFVGIATPTEAGALGAVGAVILACANRQFSFSMLDAAMNSTTRLTVMVVFLLIGSTAFALVFRGLNGDLWIEQTVTNLPGGGWTFLVVVNTIVTLLGIDLTWLGIMLAVNLQTSFLTPPFGFSLFYLRGVTPPTIPTTQIYRGVIPFIIIQLLVLLGVIVYVQQ
jgi:tripartite ATP-independent transporter DctM subunit